MNWLRDRREEIALCTGGAVVVGGLIWLAIWSEMRWQEYAAQWHCRRTGNREATTYYTSQSCGKGCSMMIPHTTYSYEYRCDGGPKGEYLWR